MYIFVNETTGGMACARTLFELENEISVANCYGYKWSMFTKSLKELDYWYVMRTLNRVAY